jgi:hypothetical protein
MTKTNTPVARRFVTLLGSRTFFRAIMALLVVQAAWIALSGRYPMAFDEDFHLGIIRLYAHHISPFWNSQPQNANMFGAVARDPSYLYQYLMSFPYRLISLFTGDQTIQVLILRAINIGLFAGGVALSRRLMMKTSASRAMIHFCLLVFVLVPITPLLAAQINYDNLLLPITALALLMTVNFNQSLAKQKRPDTKLLLQLLVLCILASLVKYAFLPLFVAIFGFVIVRLWQSYRSPAEACRQLLSGWKHVGRRLRLGLVLALLLASGLFVQRYGVNLVRYHEPVPDCSQVLSVKQCSKYGPWIRNYNLKLANIGGPHSPLTFTADWFYGMWLRSFFAVDGPATDFQTRGPLLIPGLSAIFFAVVGAVAVLTAAPKVLRRYDAPVLWLFAAAPAVYIGALWLDDYRAFLTTGQAVAINGRYLLPVLLPMLLIAVMAINEFVRDKLAAKAILATSVIVCLAWGGGTLTYILRSNDAWYWPSPAVRTANHAVQRIVGPITPGYKRPTQFLH